MILPSQCTYCGDVRLSIVSECLLIVRRASEESALGGNAVRTKHFLWFKSKIATLEIAFMFFGYSPILSRSSAS